MKHYELMFVVDASQEEVIDDIKKRIEGLITGREGSVVTFEKLGKKHLAYPIARQQYGIYFLVNLQGDGRIIQALDYFLRLNPTVLRHIILSFTEKQLKMKELTERIQLEEAERMRQGGRPQAVEPLQAVEKVDELELKEASAEALVSGPVEEILEAEPIEVTTDDSEPDRVRADEPQPEKVGSPDGDANGDKAEETQSVEVKSSEEISRPANVDELNDKTAE